VPAVTRILAIDTASDVCAVGVALPDGRALVESRTVGRGHAEILMPMIEKVLAEAGVALADLDRIAVTVGPGSFTGVRVGVAAARGLALATGVPAVGISTLAVHAAEARALGAGAVLAVVAAGRGQIYGARYDGDGKETMAAAVATPQVFAARVDGATAIAGSGSDLVLAALPMSPRVVVAHRKGTADMGVLLRLAADAPLSGEAPRPLYLRAPDARPQVGAAVARR
jgi:tRNA threonylcarbamoyladenosine biosynthesis protein TsaB